MILGAILAGGRSRRFGSDKALATIDGIALIDHAIAALAPQVDGLVLCGRIRGDLAALDDRPAPGLGPLGGLNAALHHALAHGYAGVLGVPVDVYPLPGDLRARLAGGPPRTLREQYAVGYWPAALATELDAFLARGERRMHGWIELAGAKMIDDRDLALRNVNTPSDLPPTPQTPPPPA